VTTETEEPEIQDAEVVEGEAPIVETSENVDNNEQTNE
jgi:hypothetical protein